MKMDVFWDVVVCYELTDLTASIIRAMTHNIYEKSNKITSDTTHFMTCILLLY
jgi:hypothetical protein